MRKFPRFPRFSIGNRLFSIGLMWNIAPQDPRVIFKVLSRDFKGPHSAQRLTYNGVLSRNVSTPFFEVKQTERGAQLEALANLKCKKENNVSSVMGSKEKLRNSASLENAGPWTHKNNDFIRSIGKLLFPGLTKHHTWCFGFFQNWATICKLAPSDAFSTRKPKKEKTS